MTDTTTSQADNTNQDTTTASDTVDTTAQTPTGLIGRWGHFFMLENRRLLLDNLHRVHIAVECCTSQPVKIIE